MTNKNEHDLTIQFEPIETMSHEEALLRPRPFTFRDLTGCVTTIGGSTNSLHGEQGTPAYAQAPASAGR